MAVFEEKMPRLGFLLPFFALVFLLSFPVTELGRQELHHNEGVYAALAQEAVFFPVKITAHGETLAHTFPLYPLLVRLLHEKMLLPMETALRILPLGALALLSLLVGFTCYSAGGGKEGNGMKCGAAGCAMTFATLLPAGKILAGDPILLTTFLIYSAWMGWFGLAQIRGKWSLAWLWMGASGVFIFWSGGFQALFYLLLPMAFLRRPLNIWKKMGHSGFAGGGLLILGGILLWLIPRWDGVFHPIQALPSPESFTAYLGQVFYTPLDILIRFLPWTFFLYAPFCPALIAIDKNRIFSQFLRILFWGVFFILALNPFTRGKDIFIISPLLATLSAMYYPIAVRRHGYMLNKLLFWISLIFSCLAAGTVVLLLLPEKLWQAVSFLTGFLQAARSPAELPTALFFTGAAVIPGLIALTVSLRKKTLWLSITLLSTSFMLLFWGAAQPARRIHTARKEAGSSIKKALGSYYQKGMLLYKDSMISGLYAECFYTGTKVKTVSIDTLGQLPREKEIYFLTVRPIQPPDATRLWTNLGLIPYKKQKLYIWKGTQNVRKFTEEEEFIRNMRF